VPQTGEFSGLSRENYFIPAGAQESPRRDGRGRR